MRLELILASLSLAFLAACEHSPPAEREAANAPPSTAPSGNSASSRSATVADLQAPAVKAYTNKAPAGSLLAKIDRKRLSEQMQKKDRPINIRHRCSFRNETGYNGNIALDVLNNEVKALNTAINVPLYGGSCRFDGAGFRQTARTPSIEMRHADGCTARIWTQGTQLTVAYSNCASRCTDPEVFKYIWPVLIQQKNGHCD